MASTSAASSSASTSASASSSGSSSSPYLNVFQGPNSLLDYYDPNMNAPTPLVEIPNHPFVNDNVHIYAKMMSFLPATNVKSLPALNMLKTAHEAGQFSPSNTQTVVEYSSGSTIISLGIISRLYGIPDVRAYLSNKTSESKLELLRFFGLKLTLFGGASQPEPLDPLGGINAAKEQGAKEGWFNPDQYTNPGNPGAHSRWTGPQIMRQLPNINIFAAGMGTSGTMTGTGLYLKNSNPNIIRVGVCTAAGERVPGPRSHGLLAPVEFPWREAVSTVEEIGCKESYAMSLDLCRHGVLAGPSSGLALRGLLKFLQRTKDQGQEAFDALRGPDGRIECVFICCDLPFQYINEYMQQLGEEYFPAINNAELIGKDTCAYRPEWELAAKSFAATLEKDMALEKDKQRTLLIDIRKKKDFEMSRLPFANAINIDISSLQLEKPNPFKDAPTLVKQWDALNAKLGPKNEMLKKLHPMLGENEKDRTQVICMCYDGNTAKVATSILRARGINADYVLGGYEKWNEEALPTRQMKATGVLSRIRRMLATSA